MIIGIIFTIGAFVLYGLWARVINHLATLHKKFLWMHIFLIGGISTFLVGQFPKLIAYLGINQEKFINTLNTNTIIAYSIYMLILGIIIYIGYVRKIRKKGYFIKIVSFVFLFLILLIGGLYLRLPNYILYFSIVAFIEEFVKYVFGYSLFDKYKLHYTDLILFCLISAFAFSFIENGVYSYYNIGKLHLSGFMPIVSEIGKTMTQRGFINISVHTLFTGLIGFLTMSPVFKIKKKITDENGMIIDNIGNNSNKVSISFVKIIIGIIVGVCLHILFNVSTATGIVFVLPIVVLGGYIFLSYLFYKSDSFFVKGEE